MLHVCMRLKTVGCLVEYAKFMTQTVHFLDVVLHGT